MTCLVLGAGAAMVRPLKPMAAASLKNYCNRNAAHGLLPRRVTQRRVCETCSPSSPSASRLSILHANNSSSNGIASLRQGGSVGTIDRSNHFFRAAHPTTTATSMTAAARCQRMMQQRRLLSTKNVSRSHQSSQKSSQHQTSSSRASSSILSYSSNTTAYLNPTLSTPSHPLLRLLSQSLRHALLKPRSLPLPRYISPQHFTFTLSECFGHSSFILVALSYYSQDFLELRIMAVLGSSAMLFFTYFHPHGRVLWLPLQWNVLFIAINSYRIGRVLFDRYMADKLSGEMKVFREEHLNLVDVVDYYKLMKIATEEIFEEGDLVLHQVSMRDLSCVGCYT